jgi:hypothetical protein
MVDKKINVTKKPIYSVEQDENGRYVSKYTIEIDGEEFSSVAAGTTEAEAFANVRNSYTRSLKNSKHGKALLNVSDADSVLGSPSKTTPDEVFARQQNVKDNQNNSSDLDDDFFAAAGISQVDYSQQPRTDDENQDNIMIKGQPENHVPWYTKNGVRQDSISSDELREPRTSAFLRPDDVYLLGNHNNHIILGRDYAPSPKMKSSRSTADKQYNSGFSNHMGASAIDIVAGRMSPFALEKINGEAFDYMPSFNTNPNVGELTSTVLSNGNHPGIVMDASRIYISQMTTVDKNFKITEQVYTFNAPSTEIVDALVAQDFQASGGDPVSPTSAIMIKSDKVRMHSRQDIKIVTGGPDERYNSQGNLIKRNNGIHLIAENGEDRDGFPLPQHPMVLGDNLVSCLNSLLGLIKQVNDRVDAFVQMQTEFNYTIGHGMDLLPVAFAPTVRDPRTQWQTIVSTIKGVQNRVDGLFIDVNNFNRIHNYLKDTGDQYINSAHNTVN